MATENVTQKISAASGANAPPYSIITKLGDIIGMDMSAPWTVYVNCQPVSTHNTEAAADAMYRALRFGQGTAA